MGRGLAKIFSQKGANVLLVARDVKKLESAIEYIRNVAKIPANQRFHYISADVTNPSESSRIIHEATAWNNGLPPDIVWANAGAASPSLFLDASIETLRSQMDLNYWAAAYLARATLQAWLVVAGPAVVPPKSMDTRHFIMTSSTIAFCGLAGYAPYAPGKAALRSLHDCLRSELNLYKGANGASATSSKVPKVKIHTVFPGTILTAGYEVENETKHPVTSLLEEADAGSAQTEDQVAAAAIAELEKGRSIVTTSVLGAAMRASSMQSSPRDRWFVDTVFSWLTSLVWIFVAKDLEGKVWNWGKKNGLPKHAAS